VPEFTDVTGGGEAVRGGAKGYRDVRRDGGREQRGDFDCVIRACVRACASKIKNVRMMMPATMPGVCV